MQRQRRSRLVVASGEVSQSTRRGGTKQLTKMVRGVERMTRIAYRVWTMTINPAVMALTGLPSRHDEDWW